MQVVGVLILSVKKYMVYLQIINHFDFITEHYSKLIISNFFALRQMTSTTTNSVLPVGRTFCMCNGPEEKGRSVYFLFRSIQMHATTTNLLTCIPIFHGITKNTLINNNNNEHFIYFDMPGS